MNLRSNPSTCCPPRATSSHRAPIALAYAVLLLTGVVVAGCGSKGPPLPPIQRIPAPAPDFTITRIEGDVYAKFTVPTANIGGEGPADVARVELYAITADRPPRIADPKELRELATLVATEQVRRPPLALPPVKEGMPPLPVPPLGPGVDQGSVVVLRETLTPEARTPVTLPEGDQGSPKPDETLIPRPLVAPVDGGGPQRYYFVVAMSSRGRWGPATGLVPAPLGPTSSAPSMPEIKVDETAMTLTWTPAADARGVVETADPELLPSKPIALGPPPTMYDVYEVSSNVSADGPTVTLPAPLTQAPVGALEFTQSGITLGSERCFVVRPVDIVNGIQTRGPASPMVCASFADTFPPSPPGQLDAVATGPQISLIWEPSSAADLAGYLVLRGEGGSATLTPLSTEPRPETAYNDAAVKPGVRYVYAVVAVDKAGNRSVESNRQEETAQQAHERR